MNRPEFSKLAKKIYGASDSRVKELEQIYTSSQKRVNNIISRFVADKRNWSGNAPKAEIRQFMADLKAQYNSSDDSGKKLIASVFAGMKVLTNGQLAKAETTLELTGVAKQLKTQVNIALKVIPQEVRADQYAKVESTVKPNLTAKLGHEPNAERLKTEVNRVVIGKKYTPKLTEDAIEKIVRANLGSENVGQSVNKAVYDLMQRVDSLVDESIKNHQAPQWYSDRLAKLFVGKGTNGKAALGKAEIILRSHCSYVFINQKYSEMKLRGVKAYIVLIGSSHPCSHCIDLDGTVFLISQFEVGSTAPPFHPNCQCDIEEIPEDEYSMAD